MIALHLEEGDQDQLMRDLAQGRIEMAISYSDNVQAGFDTKLLLPLSPVVYCRRITGWRAPPMSA